MQLIALLSILIASATLTILFTRSNSRNLERNTLNNANRVRDLHALAPRSEVASALLRLVTEDGAGDWPPRAAHYSLPACFQPYQDIYLKVVPNLSTDTPLLDDSLNEKRIAEFRGTMANLLAERVNISEVDAALSRFESGDRLVITREVYNAIYCCIAVCRHAYRWGIIPVVKKAQKETVLAFPLELDIPWPYFQRTFGLSGESGNIMANMVINFDERRERPYKINVRMSQLIRTTEYRFSRMFLDIEAAAFPIYHEMAISIQTYEEGNKEATLDHLKSITHQIRDLLPIFYNNMRDGRIAQSVWMRYVQGFQAWGVRKVINNHHHHHNNNDEKDNHGNEIKVTEKHDGISGNQLLFFQAVDTFLGCKQQYLSDENMARYIPANQRRLCATLAKCSIRGKLSTSNISISTERGATDDGSGNGNESMDVEIEREFVRIVKQVKLFRTSHRMRARPYLEQPAPERLIMTAGKSVLEDGSTPTTFSDAYKPLDAMMVAKLQLTV